MPNGCVSSTAVGMRNPVCIGSSGIIGSMDIESASSAGLREASSQHPHGY